jgi:hypothetical protein
MEMSNTHGGKSFRPPFERSPLLTCIAVSRLVNTQGANSSKSEGIDEDIDTLDVPQFELKIDSSSWSIREDARRRYN